MTRIVDMKLAVPDRLARLRAALAAANLDAILVNQDLNRRYLTGFTGSAGWVMVGREAALLATDFRYYEQVALESPDYELVQVSNRGLPEVLPAMLARTGQLDRQRVGFEADAAIYADVQAWTAAAQNVEWVATQGLVLGLRAVKDAGEVEALRAAVHLGDEALAVVLPQLRPGMLEREAAWLIEAYMRQHGAESASFETIVGGGPNGARPHAHAGDTPLPAGEPIVIDMGARLGGYCSDLTRTVCLGQPNDPARFWEIYNLVLRAQLAAEAFARPGVSGKDVDSVARDLIAAGGFGDQFGHSLGHGVGLAVHESPRFSQIYPGLLEAGNVVTVEPGIYVPGWGGVRIEDMILLTADGAEVLTAAPKDPIIPLA